MPADTPLLRLTQSSTGDDRYRVEIAYEGDGARRTADADVGFRLEPQDEADLRWYLEDYLQWPHDPAPKIAARVTERMEELGTGLFASIFDADRKTRKLWNAVEEALSETRVEIVTSVEEATSIPWELLREPDAEAPVALLAHSFVRAQPDARRGARTVTDDAGPVRILLAICRPDQAHDVPFRSVATRILKGLDASSREAFQLDVLRPPTFDALARALREAHGAGRPYHVLHFDGHGAHVDLAKRLEALKVSRERFSPEQLYPRTPRAGSHGYLLFENPGGEKNQRFVDGDELSGLLVETEVPVLVLNACRSAYAAPREAPEDVAPGDDAPGHPADGAETKIALGSLAQELMDSGVGGIVAMRYNVYVVTAARFIAEMYASLARGRTLGAAVSLGRKHLHDEPLREVVADPLPLEDWQVPIVYEAAPTALFPEPASGAPLEISLSATVTATGTATPGGLDPSLPPTPDAGFIGRDETLLALDRAFDTQQIVLLHAYAGSGKTATTAEFARWYALTGGVEGPVLFTSFERYTPLARVLDPVGAVFGAALEASGIHWLALDDDARRDVTLQVLAQIPVLWIWDNVEPVTGFPSGNDSVWSDEEQAELAAFLRAARETRAKFLLTSRRDEAAWLGDLPSRIAVPAMPMTERLQVARVLAAKRGRRAEAMRDWRPLLQFSGGNPLALTVLVGQALRDGLEGRKAVQAFVDRLRSGETAFDDAAGEGRSRSLAASLGYGFEHAFDEEERRRLALLHLFQGFVDVDALTTMGHPEAPWSLPEVRGLSRDAAVALLDRAAEVGLLERHGGGTYGIHPALPWFFRDLFERFYGETREAARRAFVEAMGEIGNYYHQQYEYGNRDVIGLLRAEEANLLQACRLARQQGWWPRIISTMQGLDQLYAHTGRRAEWRRLVEEIVPDFVDPETEEPLPGREEDWGLVNDYRVRLAHEERRWDEAERLQGVRVDWDRQRAAPFIDRPREDLDGSQRLAVRSLAVSQVGLGDIRREMDRADCVEAYEEALEVVESIGERAVAAACAFNLGHAYEEIFSLRDLQKAEHWYRRSLEMHDERDRLGRGRCLGQLGFVAKERFQEAREAKRPEEELLRHLNEAVRSYQQALEHFPADAVADLAVTHNQLGNVYFSAGDPDRAVAHYREAIRYRETQGNVYSASLTRRNVALALAQAGRPHDALEYARAALRGFESFEERAAADAQKTRQVIERIEKEL